MASTRKRTRITANGTKRSTWVADYFDQHGKRHLKTFDTQKAAKTWLIEAQGEVARGVHTPERAIQAGLREVSARLDRLETLLADISRKLDA
jgi:hypothetical protein